MSGSGIGNLADPLHVANKLPGNPANPFASSGDSHSPLQTAMTNAATQPNQFRPQAGFPGGMPPIGAMKPMTGMGQLQGPPSMTQFTPPQGGLGVGGMASMPQGGGMPFSPGVTNSLQTNQGQMPQGGGMPVNPTMQLPAMQGLQQTANFQQPTNPMLRNLVR